MSNNTKNIIKSSVIAVIGITTLLSSFKIIKTSEVGSVVRLGTIQDNLMHTGFNFKIPFVDKVSVHSLKQQLHTSAITPSTKDFQEVYIEYQITHSIPESSVLNNVKTITGDIFEVSIKKHINGAMRNVISHYDATFLAQNRKIIESEILKEANIELNGVAIIQEVIIMKHKFNAAFQQQVNKKMQMTQQAETAKIQKEKAQYEADSVVILAKAKAESIKIEAAALNNNPKIVELRKIEADIKIAEIITSKDSKWDGQLSGTVVGAGMFSSILPINQNAQLSK